MVAFKMKAAAGAIAMILSMPTFAGGGRAGGATEVTQLMNNAELAAQYAQQLIDYEVQWQKYLTEIEQQIPVDALEFADKVRTIKGYYDEARNVVDRGRSLYGSLVELKGLAQNRYREFASSGLTWEDYLERFAKISDNYRDTGEVMTEHEVHVMETVKNNYTKLSEVMSEIPGSRGTHQSMQMLNGQMAMLNGTINEMLSFNASMSRRETERLMLDDAKKESEELARIRENIRMETGRKADTELRSILEGYQVATPVVEEVEAEVVQE